MCSESPEKRLSIRAGIREGLPERVTLTPNLKAILRLARQGRGEEREGIILLGRGDRVSKGREGWETGVSSRNQPELGGAGTGLLTAKRQEMVDTHGQIALGNRGWNKT